MRFAALLLFALVLTGASDVAGENRAYDCEKGCYITTCDGESCTLWRCDTGTCRTAATKAQPKALPAPASSLESETAYVKICSNETSCDLVELSHGQALDLGTFDHVDHVIASRKRMRESTSD